VAGPAATTGTLTQLAPGQLAEVLGAVGAAIDQNGGSLTMPYTTLAATAAGHLTYRVPPRAMSSAPAAGRY
jgi:hypothetical protein